MSLAFSKYAVAHGIIIIISVLRWLEGGLGNYTDEHPCLTEAIDPACVPADGSLYITAQ